MISLETIREKLRSGHFEYTRHAFRRVVERNISEAEIYQAGKDRKRNNLQKFSKFYDRFRFIVPQVI